MVAKRALQFETPTSAKKPRTNAAEIAKIKRTLGERKPEMKARATGDFGTNADQTIRALDITEIAQGDGGFSRDGNQIKLHRVFYTVTAKENGTVNPLAGVDVYLITGKDSTVPAYGDFVALPGGTINKNEFSTWKQHVIGGGDNNGVVQDSHHFTYPMKVHYSGADADSAIKNRTWLVLKNNTATTAAVQLSFRIWYTDI